MAKKRKDKKIRSKDEFRRLNNIEEKGHPTYIYAKKGKNFECIGITHAEITKGIKNIPLEKNPDPQDAERAFIRPKTSKAPTKKFGRKLEGWKFTENDKRKAKKIIDKKKKGR
jgi:hypothetical protein